VEQIITRYRDAIPEFHLDEAIVGAIVPLLRRTWAQWEPLREPKLATSHLSKWKNALRIDTRSDVMTPYESLIWNLWMPPVRSAINNDWDPFEPSAAVALYQTWQPLLSSFILDNLTQQLILPKINHAVVDWDNKKPLHRALLPWMSLLGQQMDDSVSEAKRRVRSSLKSWKVQKGVSENLLIWKEAKVFSSNEWNSMLLDNVVPKLSSYLDTQLVINPQAQDTMPLEVLLSWKQLLASKILSKLLQAKFVPKWLHTLHSWLIEPRANLEEVAKWYEHWKAWFTKHDVLQLSSLQEAFQVALQLMSQAMEMGKDRHRLPLPNLKQMHAAAASVPMKTATIGNIDVKATISREEDTASTFRKIVEESMMEADLIMQSLNRKEMRSGMPLYRVSRHLDGKGGVTLYLEEDVVFVEKKGENATTTYEPVSIKDLVKMVA
jgi:tuftelin-interacting protein 11